MSIQTSRIITAQDANLQLDPNGNGKVKINSLQNASLGDSQVAVDSLGQIKKLSTDDLLPMTETVPGDKIIVQAGSSRVGDNIQTGEIYSIDAEDLSGVKGIDPSPADITADPPFISGNGTQSNPFICTPSTVSEAGGSAESLQEITVVGTELGLVSFIDISSGEAAGRFQQPAGQITNGSYTFRLKYVDSPLTPIGQGQVYDGLVQLGSTTVYFKWAVSQASNASAFGPTDAPTASPPSVDYALDGKFGTIETTWADGDRALRAFGSLVFQVNQGPLNSSSKPVTNGDLVKVAFDETDVNGAAEGDTISGSLESDDGVYFNSFSMVKDSTPGVFNLISLTGQPLGATVTSEETVLLGYNSPTTIEAVTHNFSSLKVTVGGNSKVDITSGLPTENIVVNPGETVQFEVVTSASGNTTETASITIGGKTAVLSVSTGTPASVGQDDVVATPRISSPPNFSGTEVQGDATIVSSPFALVGGSTATHATSDWQAVEAGPDATSQFLQTDVITSSPGADGNTTQTLTFASNQGLGQLIANHEVEMNASADLETDLISNVLASTSESLPTQAQMTNWDTGTAPGVGTRKVVRKGDTIIALLDGLRYAVSLNAGDSWQIRTANLLSSPPPKDNASISDIIVGQSGGAFNNRFIMIINGGNSTYYASSHSEDGINWSAPIRVGSIYIGGGIVSELPDGKLLVVTNGPSGQGANTRNPVLRLDGPSETQWSQVGSIGALTSNNGGYNDYNWAALFPPKTLSDSLYVGFYKTGIGTLIVARSTNQGNTWSISGSAGGNNWGGANPNLPNYAPGAYIIVSTALNRYVLTGTSEFTTYTTVDGDNYTIVQNPPPVSGLRWQNNEAGTKAYAVGGGKVYSTTDFVNFTVEAEVSWTQGKPSFYGSTIYTGSTGANSYGKGEATVLTLATNQDLKYFAAGDEVQPSTPYGNDWESQTFPTARFEKDPKNIWNGDPSSSGHLGMFDRNGGIARILFSPSIAIEPGQVFTIKYGLSGGSGPQANLSVFIDGSKVFEDTQLNQGPKTYTYTNSLGYTTYLDKIEASGQGTDQGQSAFVSIFQLEIDGLPFVQTKYVTSRKIISINSAAKQITVDGGSWTGTDGSGTGPTDARQSTVQITKDGKGTVSSVNTSASTLTLTNVEGVFVANDNGKGTDYHVIDKLIAGQPVPPPADETPPSQYINQQIVFQSGDKTVWQPPAEFSVGATVFTRVRYNSSQGVASSWSNWSGFEVQSIPEAGQEYGGGYYAGQIRNGSTIYNIIVAPKTSGNLQGETPNNIQYRTDSGNDGRNTAIAEDENSGWGQTSQTPGTADYPLFQWCKTLSEGPNAGDYQGTGGTGIGGYNDWYIPAKNELEILYRNFKPTFDENSTSYGSNPNSIPVGSNYTTNNPTQTSVVEFQDGNIHAFNYQKTYWSSSQYPQNWSNAWGQQFGGGGQDTEGKTSTSGWVGRAIRRELA